MKLLLRLSLLLIVGCSQAQLSVQSIPGDAEVSVLDEEGKIRPLGKTPLKTNLDDVFKSGSAYSTIQITKDDHLAESIVISKSSVPVDYEVSVKLDKVASDPKGLEAQSRSEKIAQQIAMANNLITTKRLVEAEQLMSKFILDYPYVSVGYDYMGNIQYLKKDLKRALQYYSKGLQINPDNVETREMVNKLKGILN